MKTIFGGPGAAAIAGLVDPNMPMVAKAFLTVLAPSQAPVNEQLAASKPRQLGFWPRGALPKKLSPKAQARKERKADVKVADIPTPPINKSKPPEQLRLKGVFKRGAKRGRARPKGQFDDTPTGLGWTDDDLRKMAAAILEESLSILRNDVADIEGRRWAEVYWVCCVSADGFSFENVCRLIGCNPEEMREAILAECRFLKALAPQEIEAKVAAEHLRFCTEVLPNPRKSSSGDPNEKGHPLEMRWDVLDWLSSRSKEPFSFEDCCDMNDIDATDYRDKAIAQCVFLAP